MTALPILRDAFTPAPTTTIPAGLQPRVISFALTRMGQFTWQTRAFNFQMDWHSQPIAARCIFQIQLHAASMPTTGIGKVGTSRIGAFSFEFRGNKAFLMD